MPLPRPYTYRKRLALYAAAGLLFVILLVLGDGAHGRAGLLLRTLNHFWRGVYVTACCFSLFEYTLSRWSRPQIITRITLLLAHIALFSAGLYLWRQLGILLHVYTSFSPSTSLGMAMSEQMKFSMMAVLFFGISRHIYDHLQLKSDAQQLRIEKQEAELNYLKSQTNPHFLFNTLNNIYALARDKSDLAPESILRLSQLLRFMLYETASGSIPISQELKVITDYIALEKLRYDDSLSVSLTSDVEDPAQALPPLLLIPLVENAFKHGVSESRGDPFVEIRLTLHKHQLMFTVRNSIDSSAEKPAKEGIGLSNLRRQLELLYTDFSLVVGRDHLAFTAILKINLASHA
jgi:sensor histidine kinase YesM